MFNSLIFSLLILLNSNITVVVTYFSPFGVERGVGPDVPVYAVELVDGKETLPPYVCPAGTNENSACVIQNVPSPSTFRVIASYDDGNPFYHFYCEKDVVLDQPQEYALVQCKRVWDMWFPHLISPSVKE